MRLTRLGFFCFLCDVGHSLIIIGQRGIADFNEREQDRVEERTAKKRAAAAEKARWN